MITSLRKPAGAVRRTKLISSIAATALVIGGLVAGPAHATLATTATAAVVPAPAGRVIAAGRAHTLVIEDGAVYGTGVNGTSATGTGRLTGSGTGYRTSLLRLGGLPDGVRAISVAAGSAHSLVLGSDHVVYGTGENGDGRLTGSGQRVTLIALSGLPGDAQPIAIAAGNAHSLVLGSDGKAYGTGRNSDGQLTGSSGRSTFGELRLPDGVLATAIDAGGDYSLVLGSNGKVYGTGLNTDRQLTLNPGETSNKRVTLTELIGLPNDVTATKMSAGDVHSLVIGSNGKVYGAGSNSSGQLTGANFNDDVTTLTVLAGLPAGVTATAVATGPDHSLVLGSNGKVYGAGSNSFGQLTGTNTSKITTLTELADIPNGVTATAIDAGGGSSLGVSSAGTSLVLGRDGLVYGAGFNAESALTGAGDRFVLTPLTGTQVAAGGSHSLVLARDGAVYGAGKNDFGQLTGGPSTGNRAVLTKLSGLPDDAQPIAIAAGASHSLVLDSNGNVYGTGRNNMGQLTGTGERLTLTRLNSLPDGHKAMAIAAGPDTSLVLGSNGKVYGTGNNSSGQLTGKDAHYNAFTPFSGSAESIHGNGIAIATGLSHSLVLDRANGPIRGTGSDSSFQLAGKGDRRILTELGTPFIGGVHPAVAAGGSPVSGSHSIMLASNRTVYGVGSNKFGQLTGANAWASAFTPLSPLPNGVKATTIAAGDGSSLVMGSDGLVYGTGGNASGQLTGSGNRVVLTLLGGLPSGIRATAIAAGLGYTLVVGGDGSVYGTGNNQSGQITDIGLATSTRNRLTPLRGLPNRRPIVAVAAGAAHTLVLDDNGSVYGTGSSAVGQLTGLTNQNALAPLTLPDGIHATAIAAGNHFSLVLASNGTVYGTGSNESGQLTGTGNRSSLTRLNGLPSGVLATAIAAGQSHSLVLGTNGIVYGTGNNHFGQLTDINEIGGNRQALTPLENQPHGVPAIAIAAGSNHSLVVGSNGEVYGTGDNASGQLTGTNTPTCLKSSDACSNSMTLRSRSALPPPVDTNRWELTPLTGLPAGAGAYAVAAGSNHSVVLVSGGSVYGTGSNQFGQLNSSVASTSFTTLTLTPLDGSFERPPTVAVAASGNQSFAIRQGFGSSVTAIGVNGNGQLAVRDVVGTAAAAGERHALVIDSIGGVYGAGANENGQLTGADSRAEATSLTGLSAMRAGLFKAPPAPAVPIVSVAVAGFHTLALDSNGAVYSTGLNNGGQLTGVADRRTTLTRIPGLPAGVQASKIAAGPGHSLVLGANGTVYGAGQNNIGQLTGADTAPRTELTALARLPDDVRATAVAAGVGHSLALGDDGKVYGTGSNLFGQLTGAETSHNQFTELTGLPDGVQAEAIAAGGFQSLVLGSDGVVWATGFGDRTTLTPLIGLPDGILPVAIATSGSHRLVLGSDGDVYGHGDNHCRQLTGTDTDQRDTLTRLSGLPDDVDATAIAAGGGNCGDSLVVGSNGTIYGAGNNFHRQLTGRDTSNISVLTPLSGLPGGASQAAGSIVGSAGDHTVVIGSDGAVYGTGRNGDGQLTGYEGGQNRTTLTRFTGLLTN